MQRTTPFHLQDGWPIAGFAEANLDPKAMAGLARWVNENHAYHNTHAVLVESAGHLVFEAYLEGEDELFGEPLGHRAMNVDSLRPSLGHEKRHFPAAGNRVAGQL